MDRGQMARLSLCSKRRYALLPNLNRLASKVHVRSGQRAHESYALLAEEARELEKAGGVNVKERNQGH